MKQSYRKTIFLATLLLVCIASIYWVANRPTAEVPQIPDPPQLPTEILPQKTTAELRAERDAFYKADVKPIILEADRVNRETAERCLASMTESIDGYRTGITPFCEEINTWGTRLGVVRRIPTDWWYEKTDVGDFIQAKFAKHLFSDEKLKRDIENALAQFRQDIAANENSMIIRIRASVTSKDIPSLPEIDYTAFANDIAVRLKDYSTQQAKDSVVRGLVIEIASGVGGYAAQQIVVQVVARLSAMVAASSSAAGGATASGAAIGGGGGTVAGGPIGTAVGVGAGFVVGIVIDWWMSSRFEARMSKELNELIDDLNDAVIAGNSERPGLRDGLRGTCDLMRQAYADSLRSKIVDGVSQ